MSFTAPRPYMRDLMDTLNYREWTDGFNFENIPSTIFDESYHLETGLVSGLPANQVVHQFDFPLTLRVFLKGFRDPASAIDDALLRADEINASVLSPSNRLSETTGIKDVVPGTVQVLPYDTTNDNAVILEMVFNFNLIECY